MTEQEIREYYRGAVGAITHHEETAQGIFTYARARNISPEKLLEMLKDGGDQAAEDYPNDPIAQEYLRIRSEMGHPDFAKYINAKMGGM